MVHVLEHPLHAVGKDIGRADLDRGWQIDDDGLAVLRTASMPAVLLEAGIIVNRVEEEALMSTISTNRLVAAVAGATQEYCAIISSRR